MPETTEQAVSDGEEQVIGDDFLTEEERAEREAAAGKTGRSPAGEAGSETGSEGEGGEPEGEPEGGEPEGEPGDEKPGYAEDYGDDPEEAALAMHERLQEIEDKLDAQAGVGEKDTGKKGDAETEGPQGPPKLSEEDLKKEIEKIDEEFETGSPTKATARIFQTILAKDMPKMVAGVVEEALAPFRKFHAEERKAATEAWAKGQFGKYSREVTREAKVLLKDQPWRNQGAEALKEACEQVAGKADWRHKLASVAVDSERAAEEKARKRTTSPGKGRSKPRRAQTMEEALDAEADGIINAGGGGFPF